MVFACVEFVFVFALFSLCTKSSVASLKDEDEDDEELEEDDEEEELSVCVSAFSAVSLGTLFVCFDRSSE